MKRLILILLFPTLALAQYAPMLTYQSAGVSAPTFHLDIYPGAALAFSLRKLKASYEGDCLLVRRSSDDAEQAIGFLESGHLDTVSLKSFVGANDGFAKTGYDQSGSGYDLTQTITTAQPLIVEGGVVVRQNGTPALKFNGTSMFMNTPAGTQSGLKPLWDGSNSAMIAVATIAATPLRCLMCSARGTSSLVGYDMWATTTQRIGSFQPNAANADNYNLSANNVLSGQSIIFDLLDADNATAANRSIIYVNGGAAIQNNAGTGDVSTSNSSNAFQVGASGGVAVNFWSGTIQEIIVYLSDQTANRTGMRDFMNAYYGAY